MSEPLIGHRAYVVEWDEVADVISLRSNTPGPAGSLVLEFEGLTLALDASDPGLVNFIDVSNGRVAATPADPPSLLHRLIGSEAAAAVKAIIDAASDRPQRVESVDGRREQPVPTRIARLAVSLATATTPGLLPHQSAMAALEAMAAARGAGLADALPSAAVVVEESARLAVEGGEQLVASGDRASRRLAADVCEQAADYAGRHADALLELAVRLRHDDLPAASRSSRRAASSEATVTFDPDVLPMMVAEQMPSVRRSSNDEHEVRLYGWAGRTEGWWVRVFRPGGQVPLAAVPMRIVGDDAVAELLLPERDGASFELDIVDDPGSGRPSTQLALFRAAIAAGQRAARLERLERRSEATNAWERSAGLHRQARDNDRARQADAIVSDQRASSLARRSLQVAPTLADHYLPN